MFGAPTRDVPPPPPLPKYDPTEDAPKWTIARIFKGLPPDPSRPKWTPIGTHPTSPDEPDWRGVVASKVNEIPMPEPYKHGVRTPLSYYWFDSPDYADPFKKLWYATKVAFVSSGFLVAATGIVTARNFDMKNVALLTRRIALPWSAGLLGAGITVIALSNLRGQKDDEYNYAAGGAVMASILGRKHYLHMTRYLILCVGAASYIKYANERNWALVPVFGKGKFNYGLNPGSPDGGITSGDLRFGLRSTYGDPGRDVRKTY